LTLITLLCITSKHRCPTYFAFVITMMSLEITKEPVLEIF
jgi:hypothetical protein